MTKIVRDMVLIVGFSALVGLGVNALSPAGISLVGEWDVSKGVVSPNSKSQPVSRDIEIGTVAEAYALFKEKSVVFVDARDEAAFRQGHIEGAVHLFVYDYNTTFPSFMARFPLNQPIVAYCSGRTCEDSHTLARYLKEDGYTDVRVFVDGYPAWEREGLPVEKTD